MNPRSFQLGLFAGLSVLALSAPLFGDVGPPSQLQVTETLDREYTVQWRVPQVMPSRAVPVPALPETCHPQDDRQVEVRNRAWLFTQKWSCESSIAGDYVQLHYPFPNFALTTVIRVDLLSGDRFARVVSPGDPPWQLPRGTVAPDRLRAARRAVVAGAGHALGSWVHWGLVLCVGWLGVGSSLLRVLSVFTVSQLVGSLVAASGLALDGPSAEIVLALAVVLLARAGIQPPEQRRHIAALIAIAGLAHGLSLADAGVTLAMVAILGMDAIHLILATSLVAVARWSRWPGKQLIPYVVGATALAFALGVAADRGAVVSNAASLALTPTTLSSGPAASSRRLAQNAPDVPIQSFIAIEPFEVRHEVMLRVGGLDVLKTRNTPIIDVAIQAQILGQLTDLVSSRVKLGIDGAVVEGQLQRADFMTVDSNGALPRTSPVPEPVADAVVGLVVSYPIDGMPQEVSLAWSVFPPSVAEIPITLIDPESVDSVVLSEKNDTARWQNTLTEDPVPAVIAIRVEPVRIRLPLLSLSLIGAALWLAYRRHHEYLATTRIVMAAALLAAPLAPVSVAVPGSSSWKPTERQTRRILAGLLPNVYRALEFRDEEAIFDRLAVSVTGEALTEIYLQQRRTLELEERGGARGRVEAVELLESGEVVSMEDGFEVRAKWTVGGMVTHFGHRHFRQNRYDARVGLVPIDGSWRIRSIDVLEQDRLR